ncbi:unnamed protein product [Ambrosiozyma monospora]|uniref:Unnamed protein product n=1 Tax=Ambrosiozyma monospora TaxID=43982 RepID=A0ACB5TBM6_AMBMO|nr:unnamed protein product [Ambrosiozyma monospora]
MGYNKMVVRDRFPISGASYPCESGTIDCPSSGKRLKADICVSEFNGQNCVNHPHLVVEMKRPTELRRLKGDGIEKDTDTDTQEEMKRECAGYQAFNTNLVILSDFWSFTFLKFCSDDDSSLNLKMSLKDIPFGQGSSMELIPIICGLLLKSCLKGLNKKAKKRNAELTRFSKSPSSIYRLWDIPTQHQQIPLHSAGHKNRSKPYRVPHCQFNYPIDPVKLHIMNELLKSDKTESDTHPIGTVISAKTSGAFKVLVLDSEFFCFSFFTITFSFQTLNAQDWKILTTFSKKTSANSTTLLKPVFVFGF